MNKDAERFMELLKTDKALQDKLAAAAESYAGDKTQEDVFQNVTLPVAEEAGFHFTFDELREYLLQQKDSVQTLDLDEMDQVAGGLFSGGAGFSICANKFGVGFGGTYGEDGYNVCMFIGYGDSDSICLGAGISGDVTS